MKEAVLIITIDIKGMDPQMLRGLIDSVVQDTCLLDDTIYNNIKSARAEATEMAVLEAAERAGVLNFAWELREGIQTPVGEGGARLSGEEIQRIGIARAFLRNA